MKPQNRKTLLIVACVVLAWLGGFVHFTYMLVRGIQFDAASSGMRCQVLADIIDPLENKFKILECTCGVPQDDTVELRIELNSIDQAQAFDIAHDVYELKQKSSVLHKKPLELKIWVRDPAVDGQRIVYRNPDSRYGVNLHVSIPGAPGHKKKADLEEYLELTRKWAEIHRQEELERLRAAAASANPSNADDGDAEKTASE